MEFLSFAEAQRALALAKSLLACVEAGSDTVVSAEDAELVILGLVVIVRVSEHAPHFPEVASGRG